jgi:hypothetical protein
MYQNVFVWFCPPPARRAVHDPDARCLESKAVILQLVDLFHFCHCLVSFFYRLTIFGFSFSGKKRIGIAVVFLLVGHRIPEAAAIWHMGTLLFDMSQIRSS